MRILGIDTTTRSGSIAVTDNGRLLGGLEASGGLDHSERLLPSVEYLLSRLRVGKETLDGIGVSCGPGSFTGVRIGLATAGGLARAWGLPVLGIPALEALAGVAEGVSPDTWICPWIDAGRGEVYAAAYACPGEGELVLRLEPALVQPDDWIRRLPACRTRFLGDGALHYRDLLRSERGETALAGAGPWFLAPEVARTAGARLVASPESTWPTLEPLYLRAPDAALARGKRR